MPIHERRQHVRIEDQVYFDYRIVERDNISSIDTLTEELLGKNNQRYLETMRYFQELDYQMSELSHSIALKTPSLAHYLHLLNTKIDYLARLSLIDEHLTLQKINLSLSGLSFESTEAIAVDSKVKIILYTKPKMIPILIDAHCQYCQAIEEESFHIAFHFEKLCYEAEQLLSQHIMSAKLQS